MKFTIEINDNELEDVEVKSVKIYEKQECNNPEPSNVLIGMLLYCPECGAQHIDDHDEALHNTHICVDCAHIWRPSFYASKGVVDTPEYSRSIGQIICKKK